MVTKKEFWEWSNAKKRIKSGENGKNVKESSIMFQKVFTLNLNESFFSCAQCGTYQKWEIMSDSVKNIP